ncbi:MAG: hypothetical protein M1823_000964 [Watsoniomyces obsoletus]|nr:MAG: hypothetical protein M1823_000964 [Watsoniomyces obsoletus]
MLLSESDDDTGLKKWIVKRLEDISDADSDVLADYVLALLRHESPEDQVRQLCIEQLEDFLKDHTTTFVDDVFRVIKTKSHIAGASTTQNVAASSAPLNAPTGPASLTYDPAASALVGNGIGRGGLGQHRKRSFNDQDGGEGQNSPFGRHAGGERAFKQPRRGGMRGGRFDSPANRGGRPGGNPRPNGPPYGQNTAPGNVSGLSQPPGMSFPGIAPSNSPFPFDPTDPMAAMIAMQALGFPPLPVMPGGLPGPSPLLPGLLGNGVTAGSLSGTNGQPANKSSQRCKDYDEKGFCALGSCCPYDHGTDHIVVPAQGEEYDPTNAALLTDMKRPGSGANGQPGSHHDTGGERGRGRGRGRGGLGAPSTRRGRAEFSLAGPNQDRSITTVVVENIPEENFNEQSVRDFFSAFGTIEDVQLQGYKRLALVKYDSWNSAKKAYDSPKVVFDNRFVKVYWYKPDRDEHRRMDHTNGSGKAGSPTSTQPMDDVQMEEIKRKQDEYQRAHEEKLKKIKATEESRKELEKRKEELLKSQAEEKKKLMERLAAKTAAKASSPTVSTPSATGGEGGGVSSNGPENGSKRSLSQTDALKAQLAALEAEAKSLGIDSALSDEMGSSFRGRGGWRGRGGVSPYRGGRGGGGYMPRGRGYDPSRGRGGGYRGRAYAWTGNRGGNSANNKLDNRTKKVAVSGIEFDTKKDEALREYLLGIGEFDHLESNPERPDSQIITFKDRFTAEKFITTTSEIQGIGKVELSWIQNPIIGSKTPTTSSTPNASTSVGTNNMSGTSKEGVTMEDHPMHDALDHEDGGRERDDGRDRHNEDYDVADDNDRWMS